MNFEEVLKSELDQRYQQFRWIGTQQAIVFSLYGAIIAATFALMGAFSKDGQAGNHVPWFVAILLLLGIAGVLITLGLMRSSAMQFRDSLYILELLIQLTKRSLKRKIRPAIRFRGLITVAAIPEQDDNTLNLRATFSFIHTSTIAITIAFVFGVALTLGSLALLLIDRRTLDEQTATYLWLAGVVVISLLGFFILKRVADRNNREALEDHSKLFILDDWETELRRRFGVRLRESD